MTSEKLEKVQDRVNDDYEKIISHFRKLRKKDIINSAYIIAHYNEIVDFFDSVDNEYPPFDEFIFDNILSSDRNVIKRIMEGWFNYSHPERYNFFNYEDLADIIMWEFKK